MGKIINECCVCSDYFTGQPFLISLPLFRPPYSLRHNNIDIRPTNNPAVASRCSSDRKSHASLPLNQKLEMVKRSEKGMSKDEVSLS